MANVWAADSLHNALVFLYSSCRLIATMPVCGAGVSTEEGVVVDPQAQRREAQRLRNITAQLASAADSALNRMALLADEIPSAYPTTVVPYSKV